MIPRATLFDGTPAVRQFPSETFLPEPPDDDDAPVSRRQDGWSAANQRAFLEALAEGHGVGSACRRVGLSTASAYAFRRTAKGASFALGWRAASLIARETIAETLLVRALEGQVDTYVRADGTSVTRHRHDNRLAMSLLARLDRQVESAPDSDVKAARLVAQEFDAYLDLVTRDEGPARAGLFLARRAGGLIGGGLTDDDANPADLAPIYALAAADRLVRTGIATAAEVPVDDLDPMQRAHWTAEQWARAEAAGLLRLAVPEPDIAPEPQLPQHSPDDADDEADEADDEVEDDGTTPATALFGNMPFVWWEGSEEQWRTRFPPPDDFIGEEDGDPDESDYSRTLTTDEEDAIGCAPDRYDDVALAALAEGRALFFAQAAQKRDAARARAVVWQADSLFASDGPI